MDPPPIPPERHASETLTVHPGCVTLTLFNERYRVESDRLPGWDYSRPGWYFITICTRNRAPVLSEVKNGRVHLSPIGLIVAEEWKHTEVVRANVRLDAWVVMPDHLHGLLRITHRWPRGRPPSDPPSRLHPGSLGAILCQFKSVCTKRIRGAGHTTFAWQPRFHDRVVRGDPAAIRMYIRNNPRNWTGP